MNIDCFPLDKLGPAGDEVIKTSGFGPRGGRNHNGVDYGTVQGRLNGAPIHAPFAGVVHTGVEQGGAGQWVWVTNDDGRRFKAFHLSRWEQQTWVQPGDIIGYVGTTGASSGPHLHAELWQGDRLVDCEPIFDAAFNEGRFPGTPTPEQDWFDMATPEELEAIVTKVVQRELTPIWKQLAPRGDTPSLRDVCEDTYNKVREG